MDDTITRFVHDMMGSDGPSRWLVMRTATRNGVSYVEETLRQLDDAGARDYRYKVVIAEGYGDRRIDTTWPVISYPQRTSCQMAFFRIVRGFAGTGCDYVTYEDDLEVCANAVERMLWFPVPDDCAFVTFRDGKEFPQETPNGLHRVPRIKYNRSGFWGNQAVLLPTRTIEMLARYDLSLVNKTPRYIGHGDMALGFIVARSECSTFAVHVPSLVNHVGQISTWTTRGIDAGRETKNWRGKAFDALTLPAYK